MVGKREIIRFATCEPGSPRTSEEGQDGRDAGAMMMTMTTTRKKRKMKADNVRKYVEEGEKLRYIAGSRDRSSGDSKPTANDRDVE